MSQAGGGAGESWGGALPDVIRGCWQLSRGHGRPWSREDAFSALDLAASGPEPLVLDMGDIYSGVEELVGAWLRMRPRGAERVRIHTKFVPDLVDLGRVDRSYVARAVDRSLGRLGVEALDLVQFHWWDFSIPGWIEAVSYLEEEREAGRVRKVGVTNFDAVHLGELLNRGFAVASNQVQLSLLDRRPLRGLTALCADRGIPLLCYGTLAGGLLTEEWHGRGAPAPGEGSRSVAKYSAIVDEVGGWGALQALLDGVAAVSGASGRSFAEVAAAWVLEQPSVASVIVGLTRRPDGIVGPLPRLSSQEIEVLQSRLPESVEGGVYEVERIIDGPHGRLMRYDLGGIGT